MTRFPDTMSDYSLIQAVEIPYDGLPGTIAVGLFRYEGVYHERECGVVGLLMILRSCDQYKIKFRVTLPVENASVLDDLIERQVDLVIDNFQANEGRPQ